MHPMGAVSLIGYASYQTYMADALDKLKVKVHVFRTGPHKSAVEPLISTEMSDESREQTQWLLDDIWLEYQQSLMSRRNISAEQIRSYTHDIDQTMVDTGMSLAEVALNANLVDALVTRDELMAEIQAMAGALMRKATFMSTSTPSPTIKPINQPTISPSPKWAISSPRAPLPTAFSLQAPSAGDSLAWQLKQARLNDDLSALVLRVDSPGGSAFASEIIRRELILYKQQGIPVVVSMGSLAASGGYWIAAPADEVWATPTTITGSIGAFSIVPTIDGALDSLGLNIDGVETTPLGRSLPLRPPSFRTGPNHLSATD